MCYDEYLISLYIRTTLTHYKKIVKKKFKTKLLFWLQGRPDRTSFQTWVCH